MNEGGVDEAKAKVGAQHSERRRERVRKADEVMR